MLPGLPTDLNHPILRRWQAERVSRRPLVDFVRLAWREVNLGRISTTGISPRCAITSRRSTAVCAARWSPCSRPGTRSR